MKINHQKSKVMVFNPCKSLDFRPKMILEKNQLEVVEKLKVLGVVLQSDLRWKSNTEFIMRKAYSRLWILRRLKILGADRGDLIYVYVKQVRSVVELAAHNGVPCILLLALNMYPTKKPLYYLIWNPLNKEELSSV